MEAVEPPRIPCSPSMADNEPHLLSGAGAQGTPSWVRRVTFVNPFAALLQKYLDNYDLSIRVIYILGTLGFAIGTAVMAVFPNVYVAMIMISTMGIVSMSISYCPYALLGQYHDIKQVRARVSECLQLQELGEHVKRPCPGSGRRFTWPVLPSLNSRDSPRSQAESWRHLRWSLEPFAPQDCVLPLHKGPSSCGRSCSPVAIAPVGLAVGWSLDNRWQ